MIDGPIYLDYMSTTPVDPRVIEVMLQYMGPQGCFGNPSSLTHSYGQTAAKALERAREVFAHCFGCMPDDIIFTSGATEANNLAIIGAATFYHRRGNHLVTMSTEHSSVLESFRSLEKKGFEVTYLAPRSDGLLDLNVLENALRDDTLLVSIMHVNNEIGVIQNIQSIGEIVRSRGILFHVDAAQSAGKIPIDLSKLPVDLMSFSAHKCYGPKGIGALFVRSQPRVRLFPLTFGGGQERGYRSGTVAMHQCMGMVEAINIACEEASVEQARLLQWRHRLVEVLLAYPTVSVNGSLEHRIAGQLNICFKGASFEQLSLLFRQLACSMTSACIASKIKPSYVLQALGLSVAEAQSSIRLSLGRFTTAEEVEKMIHFFNLMIPQLGE